MFSPADVEKFRGAEPFRPFVVAHRDGRSWEVHHPADAQPFAARLVLAVDHDPETGVAERAELIGWRQVFAVRPLTSRVAA